MTEDIIKEIQSMTTGYSPYEIFLDWIKCTSLAFANASTLIKTPLWRKREDEYLTTFGRYSKRDQEAICQMTGMLAIELEENPRDVLGEVYMKSEMGNKAAGQFFTPFHLSKLCAELGDYTGGLINEPSCGGGGMIIAKAVVLKEKGIDYQRKMKVIAQDLDWKGVYMTYVQLSLMGIKAKVIQGDTLNGKNPAPEQIFFTPAWNGMFV